jgi:hypothetical protein
MTGQVTPRGERTRKPMTTGSPSKKLSSRAKKRITRGQCGAAKQEKEWSSEVHVFLGGVNVVYIGTPKQA